MLTDPDGLNKLTELIIACAIGVHRALGPGLLESVYQACLVIELRFHSLTVECKKRVPLVYRGVTLDACYWIDLLVNGQVILELKSVDKLAPIHTAQMLTYLKLTKCPVGLILNFNERLMKDGIRRVIRTEDDREGSESVSK